MLPAVSVSVAKRDLSDDTRKQANAERGVLICPAPRQRTVDSSVCWGWENYKVGNPEVTYTQDFFQRKYFVIFKILCLFVCACTCMRV